MGRKLTDANRLSLNFPEIAKEWHPAKNGELTPADVSKGSGKKVWWRCEKSHEWETAPGHRSRGNGCPFCSGKYVSDINRLSIRYPDVAKQWHPSKNGDVTSNDVSYGSNKRVWWCCEQKHEWDAVISSRTLDGVGCPYCAGQRVTDENRLSIHYPDVAKQWHPAKNGDVTPDDVPYRRNKKAWWRCEKGHEWRAVIASRTMYDGRGCPYCSGYFVTDENRLSILYPEVAKQWHPTKNDDLTPYDVTYATQKKAWWLCERSHEWNAVIASRTTDGVGCPYCAGKLVTDENRLSIHYPDVAKQWHPTKNGDLTPDDVSYGSDKKAWWLCEKGHEWEASIGARCNKGSGCLFCSRKLVSDLNRLSIHYPDVAKQWHPAKNGDLTPDDFGYASNKRAWWRCARGHEWNAKISERTRGRGCARCSIPHRSKVEIYLACELAIFFDDIDPTQTHAIRTPQGEILNVDILIPSENMVIEYDALYWHKVRLEQDINKTSALKAAGWNVLRIREEPLPLIQPTDLQCEVTFIDDVAQLKRLANKTLAHLKETFGIHIPSLGEYLMSDSLTNEAAANAIIGKAAAQQLTLFAIDA